ncbi:DUF2510 domain-containing protein [Yinghuangia sp. YIM S10712]|uniref:DUF2510 domain-containing protein n=1 Tax=Yinghuangia sp. YIM S10712 TaxID=3436930 RepID=UPI003F530B46
MTSSISPGWYDDPATPGMERWWDGSQWTESTRPATTSPTSAGAPADPGPDAPLSDSAPAVPAPPGPATAPTSSAMAPNPPPGTPGTPFPPYSGYPSAPPPASTPGGPAPAPGSTRGRGVRTGLLAGAALVVVGGIVAALVVLLGGDDGDPDPVASGPTTPATASGSAPKPSPDTDGTATDAETGITLPVIKNWTVPDGGSDTTQVSDPVPCAGTDTASPGADTDPCYLGSLGVETLPGTAFDTAVADAVSDLTNNDDDNFRTTETLKDEAITVDGHDAHLFVIEVEDKAADSVGHRRTATFQYVFLDAPVQSSGQQVYPVVFIGLDNAPEAPPKSLFDTVLEGIKVGTPEPTSS